MKAMAKMRDEATQKQKATRGYDNVAQNLLEDQGSLPSNAASGTSKS